jgi:hypothetical protein
MGKGPTHGLAASLISDAHGRSQMLDFLLRSMNRHRWATSVVVFCVVVLSVGIAVYRPELFPEPWPPYYQEITPEDPAACPVTDATCYDVYTNADDEKSLAYVTKAVASGPCTVMFFRDHDGNGEIFAEGAYVDGRVSVASADLHIESPYFQQDWDSC